MTIFVTQNPERARKAWTSINCNEMNFYTSRKRKIKMNMQTLLLLYTVLHQSCALFIYILSTYSSYKCFVCTWLIYDLLHDTAYVMQHISRILPFWSGKRGSFVYCHYWFQTKCFTLSAFSLQECVCKLFFELDWGISCFPFVLLLIFIGFQSSSLWMSDEMWHKGKNKVSALPFFTSNYLLNCDVSEAGFCNVT